MALSARLQAIDSLMGSFKQQQYDEKGKLLLESSGEFRLLRPDYFAWEVRDPERQLVIADEQFLWHFDQELETVTRRPVGGREEMSPLEVLGGDEELLRTRFEVTHGAEGAFTLRPLDIDPGFRQLQLIFEGEELSGMEIVDKLNQKVVISFSRLDSTTTLDTSDFAFTPPEGVDIFYYDE